MSGLYWCNASSVISNMAAIKTCGMFALFSAVMKEYEIITLKYDGNACKLYLLYFGASEDIANSLSNPTRQHKV